MTCREVLAEYYRAARPERGPGLLSQDLSAEPLEPPQVRRLRLGAPPVSEAPVLNVVPTYDQPEGERRLRLGKTYGNLMVDVIASNAKLQNRARSALVIVRRALAQDAES